MQDETPGLLPISDIPKPTNLRSIADPTDGVSPSQPLPAVMLGMFAPSANHVQHAYPRMRVHAEHTGRLNACMFEHTCFYLTEEKALLICSFKNRFVEKCTPICEVFPPHPSTFQVEAL